jgi:hypothetical protein
LPLIIFPSILILKTQPPIGRTFPVSDISPVIAISFTNGLFKAKEINEDVIAHPADGPSLGILPSGK